MSMRNNYPWTRRISALMSLLAVLLVAAWALAAGRVQWTKTTIKESDNKSWKLEIKLFMPKAPDVPHVPMKFEFSPQAYYERSLVDGKEGVQERRVPLVGRQDMIEGVEVGFLDPGSGKIEKGTKFSFKVTRAHGYEAGEYRVTIRDARNGQIIGAPTLLKLEGENEVIDRRAMVFADPKSKKEKKEEAEKKAAEEGGEKEGAEGEEKKEGEEAAEKERTPDPAPAETTEEKPGEIKEKPGGCGCRLAGSNEGSLSALGLALVGLGLLVARRRS